MLRFLTGDELGDIKSLRYLPGGTADKSQTELKTIHTGTILNGRTNAVQALAVESGKVAAVYADGSARTFSLKDDQLEVLHEWKESRFKPDHKYVGLQISDRGIFSCTSRGALRLTTVGNQDETPSSQLASLPTRLCDWRLSSAKETFCYGGDEVDLSVWNTEKAFAPLAQETVSSSTKKRKRGNELFSGEIWRAKNVPNDFLGLRQPIRITSLTYILPSSSANQHHLLTGTQLGDVRRYDTRAARRPVADWKGIGKFGGVKVVERGLEEHEVFVSDGGCNLFSFDLRTGRVVYGYKGTPQTPRLLFSNILSRTQGISGTVTSVAPAPSILVSSALDRFSRIHSTYPPPAQGAHLEKKGAVLNRIFMNSIPTVVLWDQDASAKAIADEAAVTEEDDIWNKLEHVGDDVTR